MAGANEWTGKLVTLEISEAIATITLNRPEKRNALSLRVVQELEQCFASLPGTVKVAILCGAGEHFSAGLDLSELSEANCAEGMQHSFLWYEAFRRIQFGRVPVIGVLHGAVWAAGWSWRLRCMCAWPRNRLISACPKASAGFSWAAAARCA